MLKNYLKVVLVIVIMFFAIFPMRVTACTIFVLTDANRVLFCNNEDYSNPNTRIWFVPGGEDKYGCVYVGYNDGWAQGGMNTKGLAFDWVAGFMEKYQPDPNLKVFNGNSNIRMLETCSTVDEAITFYREYLELEFSRAKILISDRSGASVIIGAKDDKLQFEKSDNTRGFGYGRKILETALTNSPEPTVANGITILRACLQKGKDATKYSNIFDLKSGDIFLYQLQEKEDGVKLNLEDELSKGAHYYDVPQIRYQLIQPMIPLLNNMRFFLKDFTALSDQEPNVTRHFRSMIQDAIQGKMNSDDYTQEFWQNISSEQKNIQADLKSLGNMSFMILVDRKDDKDKKSYLYIIDCEYAIVLQKYVLDKNNKVALIQSEASQRKSSYNNIDK